MPTITDAQAAQQASGPLSSIGDVIGGVLNPNPQDAIVQQQQAITDLSRQTGLDPSLIAQQQMQQQNAASQLPDIPAPLMANKPTPYDQITNPVKAFGESNALQQATKTVPTSIASPVQGSEELPSEPEAPSVEQLKAGRQQQQQTPGAAQNPMASQPGFLEGLKKVQEDYLKQFGVQQNVAKQVGDIGNAIERKKADFYRQQADAAQNAATTVQSAFDTSSQRVEQQMQERQKALDKYKEMLTPEKVNEAFRPHGVFEGKSTGQSILGAIAIGLGGAGAAMQGGGATNQALGFIMKHLDKEAEARQTAFKIGLSGQQNIADEATKTAGMARQQGADAIANALQKKALQLETIQAKVEQMAAPYKGTTAQLNAQALIAGLQQQKDATNMQFQQTQMQRELMQNLSGLSFEDYDKLSPAVKTMLPEPFVKQMDEVRQRNVPGYGVAANKELAQEFNKSRPLLENGLNATQRLIDFTKNYNMYNPAQRATADTQIKALMGPLREAMGMKTLTEGDQRLLEEMIGNPNAILKLDSQKKARLNAIKQVFEEDLNSRAKSAGLKPQVGQQIQDQQNSQFGITKPNFK